MVLLDVNVLVYAHREDAIDHARYADWLAALIDSGDAYGASDLVLSGVLRVITHPRVFKQPTPGDVALAFVETFRSQENAVVIAPGPRHWEIFSGLVRRTGSKGSAVSDAYHAAVAIESGSEWITTDRGFARFPGLRWRHPLDA
jgi:toxin-antitoxin system PIN domain toxin